MTLVDRGWVISRWKWGAVVDWNFRFSELSPQDATWSLAVPDENESGVSWSRAIPGFVWTKRKNGQSIALRHWLIVSTLTLCYGVLKWVFRKRPEPQEVEP